MRYKGIIFDIDGTLASTNQLIFNTFNFVASKFLNRIFTEKEIIAMFGPPEDVILKKLFSEEIEKASEEYYNYYRENHHIARIYPGIKELIEDLKKHSVLLSIFTGKGRKSSMITLMETELLNYFDLIVTGDDVLEHKPSAEGILRFVNEFKLPKDKVNASFYGMAMGVFPFTEGFVNVYF